MPLHPIAFPFVASLLLVASLLPAPVRSQGLGAVWTPDSLSEAAHVWGSLSHHWHLDGSDQRDQLRLGFDIQGQDNTRLGFFFGREEGHLDGPVTGDITTRALGPYLGLEFGGLALLGYAVSSERSYRTPEDQFSAPGRALGLRLSRIGGDSGMDLLPFADLRHASRNLPQHLGPAGPVAAHEETETSLQLGATFKWNRPQANLQPRASLSLEVGEISGLEGTQRFVTPRVGLGLDWKPQRSTSARIDLEAGHDSRGAAELTLRGGLQLRF